MPLLSREEIKLEVARLSAESCTDIGTNPQACVNLLEHTVTLLHGNIDSWNWVGIYLLVGDSLELGPYVGKPTDHTSIPVGRGVCGTAVKEQTNIIVDDVTTRDYYLACTLETRAELVVLIRDNGLIVGQFDIDSDQTSAFTKEDESFLEQLAPLVATACANYISARHFQTRETARS